MEVPNFSALFLGIFEYFKPQNIFRNHRIGLILFIDMLEFIQYKDELEIYCSHHTVNFHEQFSVNIQGSLLSILPYKTFNTLGSCVGGY